MKSKQEVIQEAWGENYEEFKDNIDDNGWAIYPHSQKHEMIENIRPIEFRFNSSDFRPKSLAGIETNNGWTRIESEADLLNIIGKYEHVFLMGIDGEIGIGFTIVLNDKVSRKYWLENATHYQPIIKPQSPIY